MVKDERNLLEKIRGILLSALSGIIIAFLIMRIVSPTLVLGDSMNPTYHNGDRLIVNKIAYLNNSPKKGDVVIFKPYSNNKELYYVKRVIGVQGDILEIKGNKVYINMKEIKEDYLNENMNTSDLGPIKIGLGEVFVMGDNRNDSEDSRSFGPVSEENIIGKIVGNH